MHNNLHILLVYWFTVTIIFTIQFIYIKINFVMYDSSLHFNWLQNIVIDA